MTTYTGSCHCGQTAWEAKLEKDQASHVLCHCDACKKLSGSAFTLNQIIPKDAIKVTKGADSLKNYKYKGDSGNSVNCYYCPNCTTHAYHHQEVMGDKVILRTALLEKAGSFEPAAEVYGKDRYKWEKEVATTFNVMPPS
ncbi:hypothetical protein EJ08DRAFT_487322 [Tothia fuscella]|uniref:CENP-V/GFA domain-containing protein n=1 Tax=Tothia fuscella TaxID=1048955 RepID=A0A9P4TT86_9PEZI|nr:hypothetical protein EJ08DRAFT_487322 [Tothia fuscella]